MSKDGQVVAILNPDQVLVDVRRLDAFVPDRAFLVFEVRELDGGPNVPKSIELPKRARLILQALQSDKRYAVLGVSEEKRRKVTRVPSAFQQALLSSKFLESEEIVTEEVIGRSAELDGSTSLGLKVDPKVKVGDFVSAV